MKEVCREYLARAYLYLDGEVLSETERTEIRVHLEECSPCLERYGLERELVTVIARLRTTTRCPDALKNRIASLLENS
ncbi:MAG TPA: mycothiol system anti-sigma-R factor [Actinomycetota bacterium]|nr:mycothiol system anti-sigma-R factor [Actinomycetota bacterium]